jgi:hypothetical protein
LIEITGEEIGLIIIGAVIPFLIIVSCFQTKCKPVDNFYGKKKSKSRGPIRAATMKSVSHMQDNIEEKEDEVKMA